MDKFLEKYNNPYFWIGAQSIALLFTISMFIVGESSAKNTIMFGTIHILLIGLSFMDIEKRKLKEEAQ
jgi:hypothetical protein